MVGLFQVPILDVINEERAQLEPLRKNIQTVCISLLHKSYMLSNSIFILLNFWIPFGWCEACISGEKEVSLYKPMDEQCSV